MAACSEIYIASWSCKENKHIFAFAQLQAYFLQYCLFFFNSPYSRAYVQTSTPVSYYTNASQSPDPSGMWSSANPTLADYASKAPLPTFDRLTSPNFQSKTASYQVYSGQVCFFHEFFYKFVKYLNKFRMHGWAHIQHQVYLMQVHEVVQQHLTIMYLVSKIHFCYILLLSFESL